MPFCTWSSPGVTRLVCVSIESVRTTTTTQLMARIRTCLLNEDSIVDLTWGRLPCFNPSAIQIRANNRTSAPTQRWLRKDLVVKVVNCRVLTRIRSSGRKSSPSQSHPPRYRKEVAYVAEAATTQHTSRSATSSRYLLHSTTNRY